MRRWERLPDANPDEIGVPELAMLLATDLAVLDHHDGSVLLIANAINYDATDERVDEAWADAVRRLDAMQADLARQLGRVRRRRTTPAPTVEVTLAHRRGPTYLAGRRGVQGVHPRRATRSRSCCRSASTAPCPASSLDVYRVLRVDEPEPVHVPAARADRDRRRVALGRGGVRRRRLLARGAGEGRRRPRDHAPDRRARGRAARRPRTTTRCAEELLADEKERAEHLMLVDLGRNDLGRVCAPGTVEVVDFMAVERYSHVMHIVSTVVGRLAEGRTRATTCWRRPSRPGTLSGAPKPRAMEIIDELEPVRRGVYARRRRLPRLRRRPRHRDRHPHRACIKDGVAHVQAGAGPRRRLGARRREDDECRNKAAAVLRAVAMAATHAPGRLVTDARRSAADPDGARLPRVALVAAGLRRGAAPPRLGRTLGPRSVGEHGPARPSRSTLDRVGPDRRGPAVGLLALAGLAALAATPPRRPHRPGVLLGARGPRAVVVAASVRVGVDGSRRRRSRLVSERAGHRRSRPTADGHGLVARRGAVGGALLVGGRPCRGPPGRPLAGDGPPLRARPSRTARPAAEPARPAPPRPGTSSTEGTDPTARTRPGTHGPSADPTLEPRRRQAWHDVRDRRTEDDPR